VKKNKRQVLRQAALVSLSMASIAMLLACVRRVAAGVEPSGREDRAGQDGRRRGVEYRRLRLQRQGVERHL
jgi:hypothetical protein